MILILESLHERWIGVALPDEQVESWILFAA
jgi:hypothetical protein